LDKADDLNAKIRDKIEASLDEYEEEDSYDQDEDDLDMSDEEDSDEE
jgi:hypothetical protein